MPPKRVRPTLPGRLPERGRPTFDYDAARKLLADTFAQAEADLLEGSPPAVLQGIAAACNQVFRSSTQAFREVLLGCTVARIIDKSIDIRRPYVEQEGAMQEADQPAHEEHSGTGAIE